MLKSFFEFAYLIDGKQTAKRILKLVNTIGLENLHKLKAGNKCALLYSGHFSNFPLMIIWLASRGYPNAEILLKHPTELLWLHNRWKEACEIKS